MVDVLAWVLEKAGQARFSDLVARELWKPIGAECDAEVTVDGHGSALADGGISATLRDAGRVGLLALRRGRARDGQVVPKSWIDDTIKGAPDGALAFTAGDGATGYPPGAHYRNFWWITDPKLPHVQRHRNPRPVHLRARPEPDRGREAIELAGGTEYPKAPCHRRGSSRDRCGSRRLA